ncbi:phosphohistidine phosphatase [Flavobacteriaceae bacterium MAR_2010_72]|nr:phosphohistidine phosphatase [Flavobacteriaceae bacterium MAR_2010_72]TVZ59838.1 phosphohistidine phosphatase [Flavobacteriaceae bacterium MAR_2010_105]
MKNITFIRHAKSSWEYDVRDQDRPLSNRGFTDAELVSKQFESVSFQPDAVFSSPANRALTTCKIFLKNLEIPNNLLTISSDLYDFGGESVVRFIKSIDEKHQNVIIFGHNHAFTSLVNRFGDNYIDNLPTCGLVWIAFDIPTWNAIDKGKTKLIITPKELK